MPYYGMAGEIKKQERRIKETLDPDSKETQEIILCMMKVALDRQVVRLFGRSEDNFPDSER